jgi:hypothetical protein
MEPRLPPAPRRSPSVPVVALIALVLMIAAVAVGVTISNLNTSHLHIVPLCSGGHIRSVHTTKAKHVVAVCASGQSTVVE